MNNPLTTSKPSPVPAVSALVCTRGRGASIVATIKTILASDHPDFELIIVDQSPNDDTKNAVAPFLGDARLRYFHMPTMSGVCRSRNIGIRAACNDVVIITDDDCEVPPNWLSKMQAIFETNPRVAVAFCNVDAAPHDPEAGFVPGYRREGGDAHIKSIWGKFEARGIGAGMAVRRSLVEAVGGYDEMLGAGAPFPGCEEGDISVRVLLGGYELYETGSVSVLHHGFRTYEEGRSLLRRNWHGIGAAYAKPLKTGHISFVVVALYELFRHAVWPVVWSMVRLRKPRGVACIVYFFKGLEGGWRTPVNKKTLLFIPPSAAVTPSAKVPPSHA